MGYFELQYRGLDNKNHKHIISVKEIGTWKENQMQPLVEV